MDLNDYKEHNRELLEFLAFMANEFNEAGIEYYLAGSMCLFLTLQMDSGRKHGDVDIYININDIPKMERICRKFNLDYVDCSRNYLLMYGEPWHYKAVYSKDRRYHIGFYFFTGFDSFRIVSLYHVYLYDFYRTDHLLRGELNDLIFNKDNRIIVNGIQIPCFSIEETVRYKKILNRQKDLDDFKLCIDKIDQKKYERIIELRKDVPMQIIKYISENGHMKPIFQHGRYENEIQKYLGLELSTKKGEYNYGNTTL